MKVEFLQENARHIAVLSDASSLPCLFTNCVLGAEHYLGNGPRGYDCLGFLFFLIYHANWLIYHANWIIISFLFIMHTDRDCGCSWSQGFYSQCLTQCLALIQPSIHVCCVNYRAVEWMYLFGFWTEHPKLPRGLGPHLRVSLGWVRCTVACEARPSPCLPALCLSSTDQVISTLPSISVILNVILVTAALLPVLQGWQPLTCPRWGGGCEVFKNSTRVAMSRNWKSRDFCGHVFSSKPGAPCEHWGKENFWNQRELHGGVLNLGHWGCGWEKKLHFYFHSLPTANEHFLQQWIQTTHHSSVNSTCDFVASTNHRHFHIVLHILVDLSKYHLHSSLLWNHDGYLTYH